MRKYFIENFENSQKHKNLSTKVYGEVGGKRDKSKCSKDNFWLGDSRVDWLCGAN
jgi:hypothetical protein